MDLMFPYNDEENVWISNNYKSKVSVSDNAYSFFVSFLIGLSLVLLSTIIPPLIYFFRLNLL